MDFSKLIPITGSIVLEVLKFAGEMQKIYGDDVTPEQIAAAWDSSRERFLNAAKAWKETEV